MSWAIARTETVGSMYMQILNYTASGTSEAKSVGAAQLYMPDIVPVDDGGAATNQTARISGLYVVVSGVVNATKYQVSVFYI